MFLCSSFCINAQEMSPHDPQDKIIGFVSWDELARLPIPNICKYKDPGLAEYILAYKYYHGSGIQQDAQRSFDFTKKKR